MSLTLNPFLERIMKNYKELDLQSPTEELVFWQSAMIDLLHAPLNNTSSGENQLMSACNYVDMRIESTSKQVPLMAELNKITLENMSLPQIMVH